MKFRTKHAMIVYQGGEVRFAAANLAGDIAERDWLTPIEDAPFAGNFCYMGAKYVQRD